MTLKKLEKRLDYWNDLLEVINFPIIMILNVSHDEYWKHVIVGTTDNNVFITGSPEQVIEKLDTSMINMLVEIVYEWYETNNT